MFCNSVAGLHGNIGSVKALPPDLPLFAVTVLLGAVIGTTLGIAKLAPQGVLKALGLVLIVAGFQAHRGLLTAPRAFDGSEPLR